MMAYIEVLTRVMRQGIKEGEFNGAGFGNLFERDSENGKEEVDR